MKGEYWWASFSTNNQNKGSELFSNLIYINYSNYIPFLDFTIKILESWKKSVFILWTHSSVPVKTRQPLTEDNNYGMTCDIDAKQKLSIRASGEQVRQVTVHCRKESNTAAFNKQFFNKLIQTHRASWSGVRSNIKSSTSCIPVHEQHSTGISTQLSSTSSNSQKDFGKMYVSSFLSSFFYTFVYLHSRDPNYALWYTLPFC